MMSRPSAAQFNPLYGWNTSNDHYQRLSSIFALDLATSRSLATDDTVWATVVARHTAPFSRVSLVPPAGPGTNTIVENIPLVPWTPIPAWSTLGGWNDDRFTLQLPGNTLPVWTSIALDESDQRQNEEEPHDLIPQLSVLEEVSPLANPLADIAPITVVHDNEPPINWNAVQAPDPLDVNPAFAWNPAVDAQPVEMVNEGPVEEEFLDVATDVDSLSDDDMDIENEEEEEVYMFSQTDAMTDNDLTKSFLNGTNKFRLPSITFPLTIDSMAISYGIINKPLAKRIHRKLLDVNRDVKRSPLGHIVPANSEPISPIIVVDKGLFASLTGTPYKPEVTLFPSYDTRTVIGGLPAF